MPLSTQTQSGSFNTTNDSSQNPGSPAAVPVPAPMDITQQQQSITKPQNNVTVTAGSSGGGGGIGSVLGPIASILGGLFAKGGLITNNLAEGGLNTDGTYGNSGTIEPGPGNEDPNKEQSNNALATGYLVGALHQKEYGGTPDTLEEAANKVKELMMKKMNPSNKSEGFASGGAVDSGLAKQALDQALGLNRVPTAPSPVPSNNQQVQPQPRGFAAGGAPMLPPQMGSYGAPPMGDSGTPPMNMNRPPQPGSYGAPPMAARAPAGLMPNQRSIPQPPTGNPTPTNYLPNPQSNDDDMWTLSGNKGYAAGGAPMLSGPPPSAPNGPPNGPKPLQPGQSFQGDGAVKGPGGPSDDAIPARLSNGEFVFSAPSVAFFGVDKLVKMNEQGKQGFMQAQKQVQDNQSMPAPPQGAAPSPQPQPPMAPPQGSPQQQPMMQARGGTVMKTRGSGYMGL